MNGAILDIVLMWVLISAIWGRQTLKHILRNMPLSELAPRAIAALAVCEFTILAVCYQFYK